MYLACSSFRSTYSMPDFLSSVKALLTTPDDYKKVPDDLQYSQAFYFCDFCNRPIECNPLHRSVNDIKLKAW